MPGASILLVEDEALIRMMLAEMVEELGHRVVAEAGNIKDGQALAGSAVFDLALTRHKS
jgi:CheY-like chemotaxis protein